MGEDYFICDSCERTFSTVHFENTYCGRCEALLCEGCLPDGEQVLGEDLPECQFCEEGQITSALDRRISRIQEEMDNALHLKRCVLDANAKSS